MLTNRVILAKGAGTGLALILAALACGCGGGGGGAAPDTTLPTVSAPSASPASLSPTGGTITIQATATDNVAVTSVVATVTGYDPTTLQTSTKTVNLAKGSGTTWSAQHQVAAILTVPAGVADENGEATYAVSITATDSSGNKSAAASTSFKITGLPPGNP